MPNKPHNQSFSRYFPADSVPSPFHSVIYKSSDVRHPAGEGHSKNCRSHELHLKRKEEEEEKSFMQSAVKREKRSTAESSLEDVFYETLSEAIHEGPKVMEEVCDV